MFLHTSLRLQWLLCLSVALNWFTHTPYSPDLVTIAITHLCAGTISWWRSTWLQPFQQWSRLFHLIFNASAKSSFSQVHDLEVNDWIWICCCANVKNQCKRPAFFSSEQCTNLKGECIVMWKNQRKSALIFDICTSTKSYQSLTSFIHVMKSLLKIYADRVKRERIK